MAYDPLVQPEPHYAYRDSDGRAETVAVVVALTSLRPGVRATQSPQENQGIRGSQRILGIVGGMGPESTLDYYRMAIDLWRYRTSGASHPRVIVESLDGVELFELALHGAWGAIGEAIAGSLLRLEAAGAGMALIAANTAHLALGAIDPAATPFIHIADATAARARAAGHRRLGLLGTRYVMTSSIYPSRLEAAGIEVVTPPDEAMDFVHNVYYGELVGGVFRDQTRARLEAIVATMRDRQRLDGLILGGTELALILTGDAAAGIPLLNTARIHVEAGLDWLADG
jgi:aspartate racemase